MKADAIEKAKKDAAMKIKIEEDRKRAEGIAQAKAELKEKLQKADQEQAKRKLEEVTRQKAQELAK